VPDIGCVVKAKVKDKWYTAQVVKHERWGIARKYSVKAVVVIFDHDRPKAKASYDLGDPDILLTDSVRPVRYWSSGTPCMRSTNVDAHAARTDEDAAAAVAAKVKTKTGPPKYAGSPAARGALGRADAAAAALLGGLAAGGAPTTEQVTAVFGTMGKDWPTQDRPNVTPNGKPVTGFCLGAVYVLGGVGMATSQVSLAFPNLCKCVTAWVRGSLPEKDFPFSSIQINYNYMAKKHVDGNNIGPSYIVAIGEHAGGGLWTADKYIQSQDPKDGSLVVKGGGGEAVLDCRDSWSLFNGNAEHETQPVRPLPGHTDYTRVSVIVFSNSNYNKLPSFVVDEMETLGFTAQSCDGKDLPYFKRYRIDKKEFSADQNKTYVGYLMQRCEEKPPPVVTGRVCVECFGLTMNRGGGWMSFATAPNAPLPSSSSSSSSSSSKTNWLTGAGGGCGGLKGGGAEAATSLMTVEEDGVTIVELEPNRTGLHVIELEVVGEHLRMVSSHVNKQRFDTYKDEVKETSRFAEWVAKLPAGRVVAITITDTAIAAKRPPGKQLYAALELLGASTSMERLGYRLPFALIGVKGAPPGSANQAMDKTKILLRLEATAATQEGSKEKGGGVALSDFLVERTDITTLMLSED